MSDKPLHVRVAEALGCRLVQQRSAIASFVEPGSADAFYWACGCKDDGYALDGPHGGRFAGVHRYDTDWLVTGPLLEKYRLDVFYLPADCLLEPPPNGDEWHARAFGCPEPGGPVRAIRATGTTPLVAVCQLILALKAAGKL